MDTIIELYDYKENPSIGILHLMDDTNKNTFGDHFIDCFINILQKLQTCNKYKAIIIKGLPDIFCAGAAKNQLLKLFDGDLNVKDLELSELLIQVPVPLIAAMEGGAVGGGLVVGLCCDIVIMAERGMYGGGFTDLGFTPGMGFTRLLQGLVGEFIANEMIYTGKMLKGRFFRDRGLVNYSLPADMVFEKAVEIADNITEKPLKTIEILKYSLTMKKRQTLVEARVHEDFMHKISFANTEVYSRIKERYL